MKFSQVFLSVAASLLVVNAQTFTKPDAFFAEYATISQSIITYQDSVYGELSTLRQSIEGEISEYYEEAGNIFGARVTNISSSDTDIRAEIEGKSPTNACWSSLIRAVDEAISFGGYDISNCIEIPERAADLAPTNAILDELERDINVLPQILIDAAVGRNVFTESDVILARINELLTASQESITAKLDAAKASTALKEAYDASVEQFNACFDVIDGEVTSAYEAITARFATCDRYGVRGARSGGIPIINVCQFFPRVGCP